MLREKISIYPEGCIIVINHRLRYNSNGPKMQVYHIPCVSRNLDTSLTSMVVCFKLKAILAVCSKMFLTSQVVKSDSRIIILLRLPRSSLNPWYTWYKNVSDWTTTLALWFLGSMLTWFELTFTSVINWKQTQFSK